MTNNDPHREITLTRDDAGVFTASNTDGASLTFGRGEGLLTPVELLLTAIAGCSAIDVDILTSRRSEPEEFTVSVGGEKLRDEQGNHMGPIDVTFTVRFPQGEAGDAARAVLPDAVRQSSERLCTVSRTVMLSTPVSMHLSD